MARRTRGITYTDTATPHLKVLKQNIKPAMAHAISLSLTESVKTMRQQVIDAHTMTGLMRVAGETPPWPTRPAWKDGRGPGRIESGRMINSLGVEMSGSKAANARYVRGKGGFINNPPSYLAAQEEGHGKIPAMMAFTLGLTTFHHYLTPAMRDALEQAVSAASRGQVIR